MKRLFYVLLLLGLSFAAISQYFYVDYRGFIAPNSYWFKGTQGVYVGKSSCFVNGTVLSGDPCEGNAMVCTNTVITYKPAINMNWSSTDVRTATRYRSLNNLPFENYSIPSTYRVKWLDNHTYYKYDAEGECFPGLGLGNGCTKQEIWDSYNEGLEDLYPELGSASTFNYPQPVTYGVLFPNTTWFSNKKGYPMVFCHGKYKVKYGVVREEGEVGNFESFDLDEHVFSFNVPGRYAFSTSLYDVDCFGAVVGHPRNDNNNMPNNISNFVLHFFGNSTAFSTHKEFVDMHVINVVDGEMEIEVVSNKVAARDGYGRYLLETVVQNTGDFAVKINRTAAGSLQGASAFPSTKEWCRTYFGNRWECFLGNGYNVSIEPGANLTLYTIFLYNGQEIGLCGQQSIFKLEFVPEGPACVDGSQAGNFKDVKGPCSVSGLCQITPQNITIGPFEVHQWNVSCFTEQGVPTECSGDDWRFEGIGGDFVIRTSKYAYGYLYETGRKTGQVVYFQNGSKCNATVNSNPSSAVAECAFDPDSALLFIGQSQDFDLLCSLNSQPKVPDNVTYDLLGNLSGTLQPYANPVEGVTFTGVDHSSGNLRGIGWFMFSPVPTLRGAVALAPIQVGCEENEEIVCHLEFFGFSPNGEYVYRQVCECLPIGQNQTGGGGGDERKFCVINPPSQQISMLQPGHAHVACFIDEEEGAKQVECGLITWRITEGLARLQNQLGEDVVFTAIPGVTTGSGMIAAKMDNNKECEAAFEVKPYTCPEVS